MVGEIRALRPSHALQPFGDRQPRIPPVMHGGHNEIGTTDIVATGKNFRLSGLIGQAARYLNATAVLQADAVLFQPRRRAWTKAEGGNHDIGREYFFSPLMAENSDRAVSDFSVCVSCKCTPVTLSFPSMATGA